MITADSSVWIAFLNGHPSAQADALDTVLDDSANEVVLLDVVLMEVLRGFRQDRDWRLAKRLFSALPVFTAGGELVTVAAATLYRDLRRRGLTVRSPIDLLIGTWCIENQCVLIHGDGDGDFDGMVRHHGLATWKLS